MSILGKTIQEQIRLLETKGIPEADRDPARLQFHLMPPTGWLNDPNGLCQSGGFYHVFFQYCPFDVNRGLTVWGHYRSRDLICWEYLGAALVPDFPGDCTSVYSGSALALENGGIWAVYTGNVKYDGDFDYIDEGRESNTISCVSADGVHFGNKRCLLSNDDYPADCTLHVRDPKVWEEDGVYYLALGARKRRDGSQKRSWKEQDRDYGAVLLYRSEDRIRWSFVKEISSRQPFGYMWECPDLFRVEDRWVLSLSPQGLTRGAFRYQNVYQSGYFLTESRTLPDFVQEEQFREWDMGFDFYAPQTFEDESGRRILIGWIGMPDSEKEYRNPTTEYGWQHALTVPRQILPGENGLRQRPVEELERLRGSMRIIEDGRETAVPGRIFDLEVDEIENRPFHMRVAGELTLQYSDGVFLVGFSGAEAGRRLGGGRTARRARIGKLFSVRVLADTSVLEIYLNGGETVFTTRYYPEEAPVLKIACPGSRKRLWEMRSMTVKFV